MMGRGGKEQLRKTPGTVPPTAGKARGKTPQSQPGLVERLIRMQGAIGNTAMNVVIEGLKAGGAAGVGPQPPQQGQSAVQAMAPGQTVCTPDGRPIDGPVDPWAANVPCAPLEQRLGDFHEMLNEVWNQEQDYDKRMLAYGDWDRYFTEKELEEVRQKDGGIWGRIQRYNKFYDPGRPGKPKEWGPMSVEYGNPNERAELAGNTLDNMESSLLGAVFEGVASWFTDDPVKLNAASGMGAGINDMMAGAAMTQEARDSIPDLSPRAADITTPMKSLEQDTSPGPSFTMSGRGYTTWGFSLNVDEPQAVGEPGISQAESMRRASDLGNRQFLDFMTNQATKGERTEVPSSARSLPDRGPVSVVDDPAALICRPSLGGIPEWDTFSAEVMARKGPTLAGKSPSQVKESLNKEIVNQLKKPRSDAARAISDALSNLLGIPATQLFRRVEVTRTPVEDENQ